MTELIILTLISYGIINIPISVRPNFSKLYNKLITCYVCKSFWTNIILSLILFKDIILGLSSFGLTVIIYQLLHLNNIEISNALDRLENDMNNSGSGKII